MADPREIAERLTEAQRRAVPFMREVFRPFSPKDRAMADDIVERLQFKGRHAAESEDQAATRRIAERKEGADEISRLREEVEQARVDRDEAREVARKWKDAAAETARDADAAESEAATLRERVKDLEEGLRPFARVPHSPGRPDSETVMVMRHVSADEHSKRGEDGRPPLGEGAREILSLDGLRLLDFRRSRSLLTNQEQG